MNINEKLDGLKFLSQTHRSLHDQRRKYEWKIIFTTLTFYVLCVSAVYTDAATISLTCPVKIVIWFLFPILAISVSIFLKSLHKANAKNQTISMNAENSIDKLLVAEDTVIKSVIPTKKDMENIGSEYSFMKFFSCGEGRIWAWRWQIVILVFFSIVASVLIQFK